MTSNLHVRWYVHPNDLVGGWSVNNVDKPVSQCDHTQGEMEVADFTTEEDAHHIVMLHNAWLGVQPS